MMAMVLLGAGDTTAATEAAAATFMTGVIEGVGVLTCVVVAVSVGNGVKLGLELMGTPPVIVVVQDGVAEAVQVPLAVQLAVAVPVPVLVGVAPGRV
jgi:hypothetical protein